MSASAHSNELFRPYHDRQLVSSFTIAILAATLLGMGIGNNLPEELRQCALLAGSVGFGYYLLHSYFEYRSWRHHVADQRLVIEHRLDARTAVSRMNRPRQLWPNEFQTDILPHG